MVIDHRLQRAATGWLYFAVRRQPGAGWVQIGGELLGFTDDFGNFIPHRQR